MCGFHDRNGFHAAGECNTYLCSNGKRAIVVRDDGVSGKAEASAVTIFVNPFFAKSDFCCLIRRI